MGIQNRAEKAQNWLLGSLTLGGNLDGQMKVLVTICFIKKRTSWTDKCSLCMGNVDDLTKDGMG